MDLYISYTSLMLYYGYFALQYTLYTYNIVYDEHIVPLKWCIKCIKCITMHVYTVSIHCVYLYCLIVQLSTV